MPSSWTFPKISGKWAFFSAVFFAFVCFSVIFFALFFLFGRCACSFHQLAFRVANPRSEDPRSVPDMIIHSFYKQMSAPTKAEGFVDVETVSIGPTVLGSPMEAFLMSGFLE